MGCSIRFGLLITILVFSVSEAAPSKGKLYWESQLPNTHMPLPVIDALPKDDNVDNHFKVVGDANNHPWDTVDEVMLQGYGFDDDPTHRPWDTVDEVMLQGYGVEDDPSHHPWDAVDNVMLQGYGVEDDPYHEELQKNHTDFVTSNFFLAKNLFLGAKLNVRFKSEGIFTRFPPYSLAQTMPPFNSQNINNLLRFFSIEPGSTEARILLFNLRLCERNDPINGKWQSCATSLDQLVSYLSSTLGRSNDIKALTLHPSAFKRGRLMTYKVVEINVVATEKYMVACHRAGFPYAVFRCHQPMATTAYKITLVGVDDGVKVTAYGVCHYDTNGWYPEFIGLKALGVKAGTPICHFLQSHDVVWYRTSQARLKAGP